MNFFILEKDSFIPYNLNNIKKTIEILNKDKLIIIKWLKNTWKINFIKEFIHKTNLKSKYFYFNKSDDIENRIPTNKELDLLLNEYIQLYKKPKIIILQNISKIDWIKDFITKIYKLNYKTILVWNTIKIWWIKELEILTNKVITIDNLYDSLKYWTINEIKILESDNLKEKFLKLILNDIFLNDIFLNYWVKSILLYTFTLTYISKNNYYISLRELQKNLGEIKNISLKTTIDYVDFSIQEKILKRVYKYYIKNNKAITSKAKYYFSDNWIRNSLSNFQLNNKILLENMVFNILELYNYNIYWWIIWKFEFTFYWEIENNSSIKEKIYIHISEHNSKEEIKKEVSKLLKIWDENKKYILVEDIKKIWINKLIYDDLEILEINDFILKFNK